MCPIVEARYLRKFVHTVLELNAARAISPLLVGPRNGYDKKLGLSWPQDLNEGCRYTGAGARELLCCCIPERQDLYR